MNAFILAAGEGTRLRPLTEDIPKPLLPVFHKSLLSFALDNILAAGITNIALNTRYLHEAFYREFEVKLTSDYQGVGSYERQPLHVFHELVHLDTGGGIRNARSILDKDTFLLHNGDILTDASLTELIAHHRASGSIATLLLREEGGKANVCYNEETGFIEDFRGALHATNFEGNKKTLSLVYGGIAVLEPALIDWIAPSGPVSIIDSLLDTMKAGHPVAGFVSRGGFWSDLGTPESYLGAHLTIAQEGWRPPYPLRSHSVQWPETIHPSATIASSAALEGTVVIGAHARVDDGAFLKNCVLLPGATIQPGAELSHCIVRSSSCISGCHQDGIL